MIMDLAMPEQEGIETIRPAPGPATTQDHRDVRPVCRPPAACRRSSSAPRHRSPSPFSRMSCWATVARVMVGSSKRRDNRSKEG